MIFIKSLKEEINNQYLGELIFNILTKSDIQAAAAIERVSVGSLNSACHAGSVNSCLLYTSDAADE